MKNLIKLEFKKNRVAFTIAVVVSFIISCLLVVSVTKGYIYNNNIEIWEQSLEIFDILFPLFAVIPTCWLMFYERHNGFIGFVYTRISIKKYIITKWLVSSISGAFIVFLFSFISLTISLYFIPKVEPTLTDNTIDRYLGYYILNTPFLYGLLLCLWKGFLGFLMVSLGFSISLFINNLFIILIGPFVYLMLENFILAILNVPYYRLITSFDPSTLTSTAISTPRLLTGPLLLALFIIGLISYYKFIKQKTIFDI